MAEAESVPFRIKSREDPLLPFEQEVARALRRLGYAMGLLCLVIVAAFLFLYVVRVTDLRELRQKDRAFDRHQQALIVKQRHEITRLKTTVKLLCNWGYVIDGLNTLAITIVRQQVPNSGELVDRLRSYHLQLLDQLSDPESPCVAP